MGVKFDSNFALINTAMVIAEVELNWTDLKGLAANASHNHLTRSSGIREVAGLPALCLRAIHADLAAAAAYPRGWGQFSMRARAN